MSSSNLFQKIQSEQFFGIPSAPSSCGCNNPWITKRAGKSVGGDGAVASDKQDVTLQIILGVGLLGASIWYFSKQR